MISTTTYNKTKTIATVGPASSSYEMLLELVNAGVDVFRLNFSHGTHNEHLQVINRIHYINNKYNTHIGILADLQGPKLRVGDIEGDGVNLEQDDLITFTNKEVLGNKERVYMSYRQFAADVKEGERILVDDGKIVLEVEEIVDDSSVKLRVLFGGILSSNKGVNLPDTKISLPSLTEKDYRDLEFILTQDIHWIALSFVRKPVDLLRLEAILKENNHPAKIIAKIEKPEAVENIDKIIKSCNAVMVARGDLGVEMPMEQLPSIQKSIIKKCIARSRPVIVATQMMESMINDPSPTRAEVTDVANAVLDGTDAVMLSGETSIGKHPTLVVEAMNKIIEESEKVLEPIKRPSLSDKSATFLSDVVCLNATTTAENVKASAIIGMTYSGYTAFKMSSFRPMSPVFIFSERHTILSTLNLVWGVKCFYYDKYASTDETHKDVNNILKSKGYLEKGDIVVNTGSMPIAERLRTNMLKVSIVD